MKHNDNSLDGHVRIPASALSAIRLQHLVSQLDLTIAVTREDGRATPTGITEWVGSWHDITLTIGWDWAMLAGQLVLVNPNEIRTNIQLVKQNGQLQRPSIARLHLLYWIESHPWQQMAVQALDSEEASLR